MLGSQHPLHVFGNRVHFQRRRCVQRLCLCIQRDGRAQFFRVQLFHRQRVYRPVHGVAPRTTRDTRETRETRERLRCHSEPAHSHADCGQGPPAQLHNKNHALRKGVLHSELHVCFTRAAAHGVRAHAPAPCRHTELHQSRRHQPQRDFDPLQTARGSCI